MCGPRRDEELLAKNRMATLPGQRREHLELLGRQVSHDRLVRRPFP